MSVADRSHDYRHGTARPVGAVTARHPRWFVACHSARVVLRRGAFELTPTSMVHAKEMGTGLTACGRPTMTWRKLWDVPFPAAGSDICPACRATVFES